MGTTMWECLFYLFDISLNIIKFSNFHLIAFREAILIIDFKGGSQQSSIYNFPSYRRSWIYCDLDYLNDI